MTEVRRAPRVAVAMLILCGLCGTAAFGAAELTSERAQFRALLSDAAAAYDRGDPATARARLLDAERMTAAERFQGLLATAGQAYDRQDFATARRATRSAESLLNPWLWLILGFVGQGLFCARFVVQWLASEKKGRSVVPVSFWYLSIVGSLIVLCYALLRWDAVFILAYAFNSLIYVRNLMLIHRPRQAAAAPSQ